MIIHSKEMLLSGQVVSFLGVVSVMETVTLCAKTQMTQYHHCKEKSDIYGEMILQLDGSITFFFSSDF